MPDRPLSRARPGGPGTRTSPEAGHREADPLLGQRGAGAARPFVPEVILIGEAAGA